MLNHLLIFVVVDDVLMLCLCRAGQHTHTQPPGGRTPARATLGRDPCCQLGSVHRGELSTVDNRQLTPPYDELEG